MKISLRLAAIVFSLMMCATSHAESFKFSYAWGGRADATVTGYFDGTVDGNLIENITKLSVFDAAGLAYAGNGGLVARSLFTDRVRASFDGRQNEFGADEAGDGTGAFFMLSSFLGMQYYRGTTDLQYLKDNSYSASYWSVSVVPEPESYGMMLAGLALVGVVARCRKIS